MTKLPTGTVTFLFTDVEGSTRLLRELGDGYAGALAEHRRMLRDAFTRHGGVEVDTQGDAFFFAFERASEALAAASEGREALEQGPIRVRMGLHTGEPITTGEGYVGIDVHRAARIAAAGHGGQILVSQTTRNLVPSDGLRDLGEHRLKDLTEPERIYQLGDGTFPPLRTRRQGNLPGAPEPLLGRKKELADLLRLLRAGASRLLTITGTGGVGKTRLAIELAGEVEQEFLDGVWFVDLAPLVEPELVLPTIASAVGARGELSQHLRERSLLLVLDNFEHVLEAAPGLAGTLDGADGVVALVTSRALLRIGGEREYRLRPLAEAPAIELFRTRAESADARFDAGYAELAELCRRLDQLPLAIELAAARARLLAPEKLIDRLEQRLPLLSGGRRDAPERQRTLTATIEWSHNLLTAEEKELFAGLAVFAGGWTIEAAEEVCGAEIDSIQSLLDNSLVRRARDRITMLETIHEYALDRLVESGKSQDARTRHASYFVDLVERARDGAAGSDAQARLAALRGEFDNLRTALGWLQESGQPDVALRLAIELYPVWIVGGHAHEGRKAMESVLAASDRLPAELQASAWKLAGDLALDEGDFPAAKTHLEQALSLNRRLGRDEGVGGCLTDLGHVAKCEGDYRAAEAYFAESIGLARHLQDGQLLAESLLNFGDCLLSLGDAVGAQRACDESLAIYRETGHTLGVAACFFSLGLACLQQDRHQDALELLGQSLEACAELQYMVGISYAFEGLAAVAGVRGDAEEAAVLLGAAEVLRERAGVSLEPYEGALHERTLAVLRAELGPERVAQLWATGRTIALDEAIGRALSRRRTG